MLHTETVGWRELVDFPDWELEGIRAKADTGARSSALDVTEIEELPGDRVRFTVATGPRDAPQRLVLEAAIVRRARVRSSFGAAHDRMFVMARVAFAGRVFETEVGLVSRKNMLCQMLLGRQTLKQGPYLVDPGRVYLHGRQRKRKTPSSQVNSEAAS